MAVDDFSSGELISRVEINQTGSLSPTFYLLQRAGEKKVQFSSNALYVTI